MLKCFRLFPLKFLDGNDSGDLSWEDDENDSDSSSIGDLYDTENWDAIREYDQKL